MEYLSNILTILSGITMVFLSNIATILSGFSTVAIAILTVFLYRENRLLRMAGSEPQLVAYFEPHPDGTGGLNIAIANVGTGPARDVYFEFKEESESFSSYNLILDCTAKRGPMTLIPQGEKISILFAIGYQLFKQKDNGINEPLAPFKVQLEWTNLGKSKINRREFILDVKPYANLPGFVSKPYLLKIADSIDNVSDSIYKANENIKNLSNLIEANTLDCSTVKKIKGNTQKS